ncbi:ribonuclease III domain-containing protein [Candidatus Lokiarchaeum ossiferum]|uniref:ribonuclease III domain-containing protein n=1 Tax=Candidatus Lokiarchaeum ossiferum TaxID=2951803 RepID=UPI00352F50F5
MNETSPNCEYCPECDNLLRYHKNAEGKAEQICFCGHCEPCKNQHYPLNLKEEEKICNQSSFTQKMELMHLTKLEKSLITRILTHPSYHQLDPDAEDYRPLDFLGDAVLDLIVREQQLNKNPRKAVVKRNHLVSNAYLAQIFNQMDLIVAVRKRPNYELNTHDKGSIIEGFFGSYYQSFGLSGCKKLWNRMNFNLKGIPR